MNKADKIEKYIKEFLEERKPNFDMFYKDTFENRRMGIYRLKEGSLLMNFLDNISGNLDERLSGKLIPQKFGSSDSLMQYLVAFEVQLEAGQALLDLNKNYEPTYYVEHTQEIKNALVEMINNVVSHYSLDEEVIPLNNLKKALSEKDLNSFVKIIQSVLATVPYLIKKKQEGFVHSNIHTILILLGFDIVSEEPTNLGRIDSVIRFEKIIYIIEFKLGTSQEALSQIKKTKYHEKFILLKKEIVFVGIGITKDGKNIEEHLMETYVNTTK